MTQEIEHKIVLENHMQSEYYERSPDSVVISLNERSIKRLLAAKRAYELASEAFEEGSDLHSVDVSFYGFEYMVEDDEADFDEGGNLPLKPWEDRWEMSEVRVNSFGFYFRSTIKHTNIEMESDSLSFADFDEELRKYRSLVMASSLEQVMSGNEDAAAPSAKPSGLAPL